MRIVQLVAGYFLNVAEYFLNVAGYSSYDLLHVVGYFLYVVLLTKSSDEALKSVQLTLTHLQSPPKICLSQRNYESFFS